MQRFVNSINIFWVLAYNGIVDNTVKNTMYYVEDVGCDFPELRRRRFLIVNNTPISYYMVWLLLSIAVICSSIFNQQGALAGMRIFFYKM